MKTWLCATFVVLVACEVPPEKASDVAMERHAEWPPGSTPPSGLRNNVVTANLAVPVSGARALHIEKRRQVPSLWWLGATERNPASAQVGLSPDEAALVHLRAHAKLYRLNDASLDAVRVARLDPISKSVWLVQLTQEVAGLPVWRDRMTVAIGKNGVLLGISGWLSSHVPAAPNFSFVLDEDEAVYRAYHDLVGTNAPPLSLGEAEKGENGYRRIPLRLAPDSAVQARGPARVRRLLYDEGSRLVAAYLVELDLTQMDTHRPLAYGYIVAADDGRFLLRHNLVADAAYTYRVWADERGVPWDGPEGDGALPHPTGIPDLFRAPLVAPRSVSLEFGPISTEDPWLSDDANQSVGNNVDAYADIVAPDGYNGPDSGDLRGYLSSDNTFDWTYDFTAQPGASDTQRLAAITHAFYVNNWLHDWMYDAGFDEESGNAQQNNFGRGGLALDRVLVEIQDHSGTNNADMLTPADGASPRMQMYRFSGSVELEVDTQGPLPRGSASFGPQLFELEAPLVLGDASGSSELCTAVTNDVANRIVLADRGSCTFLSKAANAQAAGAVGLLIANNVSGAPPDMVGDASPIIAIPVLSTSLEAGQAIRTELAAGGTPIAKLLRGPELDSALDTAILAHEWAHMLSNRLVGNAYGLSSNFAQGLGEGWSDFLALLLLARPDDSNLGTWDGAFPMSTYVTRGIVGDAGFFGIRRYPYSTDFTKNALTFRHIEHGQALPIGVPANDYGGSNAQVHNTGEVWASMLWECYTSILRDTERLTFDEARRRMRDYLVHSLKLTPNDPTLTEARDALLFAIGMADLEDYAACFEAFARRGAGVGALSPERYDTNNNGVVESFDAGNNIALEDFQLHDENFSCDDDGILDCGERGTASFLITNIGSGWIASPSVELGHDDWASLPAGTSLVLPDLAPLSSRRVEFPVDLLSTSERSLRLTATVTSTSLSVSPQYQLTRQFAIHDDVMKDNSTLDSFAARETAWTATEDTQYSTSTPWRRVDLGPRDVKWFAPGVGAVADRWLISPVLQASDEPGVHLVVRFSHAYQFEQSSGEFWDGGVIEISADNGTSWQDLDGFLSSGYTGVIANNPQSPIRNRRAYVGASAGYPTPVEEVIDLGTAFAGQPVQIRFRAASDEIIFEEGWSIHSVQVEGITNLPFDELITETNEACLQSAPTADAGADVATDERIAVALDGSASSDPNGRALQFKWQQTAGPAVTLVSDTVPTPTFVAPEVGEDTELVFSLVVSSPYLDSSPDEVRIMVRQVNRMPVAHAGDDIRVDERTQVMLDGSDSEDVDGDQLQYTWTQLSGPAALIQNANAIAPIFDAPEVNVDATLVFSLTVSDGELTSAADEVHVHVRQVNRAPSADAGADFSVDERSVGYLTGEGSIDIDGDDISFAWTQTSGPVVALKDANTARPFFDAPEVNEDTPLVFSLRVSDGDLDSDYDEVQVLVRQINRAPTAQARTDIVVDERVEIVLDGSASDDIDGDEISYEWTQVSGPAIVLSGANTVNPSFVGPEVDDDAMIVLSLIVSDGDLFSAPIEVRVLVRQVNRLPTADAGADLSTDERMQTVLDGSGSSDIDGDSITFAWTQIAGPAVAILGANTVSPSFVAPEVATDATIVFLLLVSDRHLASDTDEVVVRVRQVNRAPMADAGGDFSTNERTETVLDGSGSSDVDGDSITYAWTQVSGPTVTLIGADTATPRFVAPEVTSDRALVFSLRVSDNDLVSPADEVVVSVKQVNRPPTASAGRDFSADERTEVLLDGSGSNDIDGDSISFTWTQTAGPATLLTAASTVAPRLVLPEVTSDTTFVFSLVVSDGQLVSTADEVSVQVRHVNRRPTADAGADFSADERLEVVLDGSGSSDMDGDAISYTWRQVSGPELQLVDLNSPAPHFVAPEVTSDTWLVFALEVSDGDLVSDVDEVEVLIRQVNRVPTAHAGADFAADERTEVFLDGSGSVDMDGDPISYAWSQSSGPAVALIDAHTATPHFVSPEVSADTLLVFSLFVSDGDLVGAADEVEVLVRHVNRVPTAFAGSDLSTDERLEVVLDGSGSSDIDGDEISYAWSQISGPVVTLVTVDSATPRFVAPEVSSDTILVFSLRVADSDLISEEDHVEVLVRHVNRVPLVNAGEDFTAEERNVVMLNGEESIDPDGDSVSYVWTQVSGPPARLLDESTARPSFVAPEVSADAIAVFSLQVSDGDLTSDLDWVEVLILHVNRAPVVAFIESELIVDERDEVSLNASVSSDPDGDSLEYEWTQTVGPAVTLINPQNAQARFVAPEVTEETGMVFTLTVSDGVSASSGEVQVFVRSVNRPPLASAGDDFSVAERSDVALDGSGSSDSDGDPISYAWTQVEGPSVELIAADTDAPKFRSPDVSNDTNLVFLLVVTDGDLFSIGDEVSVLVQQINRAPVANAGDDQTVEERAAVVLDGAASWDIDEDPISYAWTQVSGPTVTLMAVDTVAPHFVAPEVEADTRATFSLLVSDGEMESTDVVEVSILQINRPPVALIEGPREAMSGETIELHGGGSTDPDGDGLTYAWEQQAGPATTLNNVQAASVSFAVPQTQVVDLLLFSLTVTDPDGAISTQDWQVEIMPSIDEYEPKNNEPDPVDLPTNEFWNCQQATGSQAHAYGMFACWLWLRTLRGRRKRLRTQR